MPVNIKDLSRWDVSPKEAVRIQKELRSLVDQRASLGEVKLVAGIDASYDRPSATTHAAAAALSWPSMETRASSAVSRSTRFPYVPGLLSFRETPVVLEALAALDARPSLLLCDGHGYAHPRRFGLACHVGLLVDLPTIGVAKRVLVGSHAPVPEARGAWQPLVDQDEVIGAALRSRAGAKPIYVSVGHKITLESAVQWALRCCKRYKLPEPIRIADRLASAQRREVLGS